MKVALQVPAAISRKVDERDKERCTRCGVWIESNGSRHHRQRRQVGGHDVFNIILLCGSGTTGCHGWVHSHPLAARHLGFIVKSRVKEVSEVPLLVLDFDVSATPFFAILTADGKREPMLEATALEMLGMVA